MKKNKKNTRNKGIMQINELVAKRDLQARTTS
jgi:hypothetical protein